LSESRKSFIEKFIEALTSAKNNGLSHFLEDDAHKTVNSKVVYNNLQEALDYYIRERDGKSTSHWTIVECEAEDPNTNTLRARISHDNKTSDTVYTFSSSGKIQRIDAVN